MLPSHIFSLCMLVCARSLTRRVLKDAVVDRFDLNEEGEKILNEDARVKQLVKEAISKAVVSFSLHCTDYITRCNRPDDSNAVFDRKRGRSKSGQTRTRRRDQSGFNLRRNPKRRAK